MRLNVVHEENTITIVLFHFRMTPISGIVNPKNVLFSLFSKHINFLIFLWLQTHQKIPGLTLQNIQKKVTLWLNAGKGLPASPKYLNPCKSFNITVRHLQNSFREHV